jgi:membrane-anchored mycosin MYCP
MDRERTSTVDLHKANEIVVEEDYVRLVVDELAVFGVRKAAEPDRNDRLGLERLTLTGTAVSAEVASTDAGVDAAVQPYWDRAMQSIVAAGGPPPTFLDVCLAAMRRRFADRYGEWYPTMGKNRDIADIEGLPYISGGGVVSKVPKPAEAHTLPRWESTEPTGVRVGIADTPIYANPQLDGRYQNFGKEFSPDGEVKPAAGHSTFIAGLVLQRAPGATLIVRPVLDQGARATAWDVATALMDFLDEDKQVDVLPLALGTYARDGRAPLVLARAIERLAPHTVVLAAAGNHGEEPSVAAEPGRLTKKAVTYPAAIDDVCAVAAAGADGELASFSPPRLPWFKLRAPGVDVESLFLDGPVLTHPDETEPALRAPDFGGWAVWSGSSFAVATVAGEIARRTVPGTDRTARRALSEILAGAACPDICPV